jgi:hypothetical protein
VAGRQAENLLYVSIPIYSSMPQELTLFLAISVMTTRWLQMVNLLASQQHKSSHKRQPLPTCSQVHQVIPSMTSYRSLAEVVVDLVRLLLQLLLVVPWEVERPQQIRWRALRAFQFRVEGR